MPPPYTEVDPSPQPEYYENSKGQLHFRATRILSCAWSNVQALCEYLYSPEGAAYPCSIGSSNAIVRRVKPLRRGRIGGTETLSSYTDALVEVYYDTDGPRWVSGFYVDEKVAPHQFYIRTPGGLFWSGHTAVSDAEAGFTMPVMGAAHILEVKRATSIPSDAFAYVGCCNGGAKSCILLPYSFPSQTVLYNPPHVGADFSYSYGTRYEYTYIHEISPFGWNKFFRPSRGRWENLYNDNGDTYVQYPPSW